MIFKLKPKVVKVVLLIQEMSFEEKGQLLLLYFLPPLVLLGGISAYTLFNYLKQKNDGKTIEKPKTKIKSINDFL